MSGYYMNNNDAAMSEARMLLNKMSVDELSRLMTNEDELTKVVQQLPEIQQSEAIVRSLEENIKHVAARNLGKESTLQQEKQKLMSLHYELAQKRDQLKSLGGQTEETNVENNPDITLALLRSAASNLDDQTEKIADNFFYGSKTEEEVMEFERRFLEDRSRTHELKFKAEKFHELLQMSQSTSYLNSQQNYRSGGYR